MEKRTAFITGGTKGIGFGIAEALINEGINVAITGRSQASVDSALKTLQAKSIAGTKVIGFPADVRQYTEVATVIQQTIEELGSVDILIANAGLGNFAPVDELTIDQWHAMIDTNLTGTFYTLKAGVEALKKSKGYFFTISSLAGTNFFQNGSAYNASKFGVTGFTQAAMLDLRKYNIKTSTIMPGSVATYFNDHIPNEKDDWKIQKEDIGQIVVDLLNMNPRTLPSKIEVRPSFPPQK